MSFGSASTRPQAQAPCPCGGGVFGDCCAPILDGAPAPSAERLMRSRYSAFALGDEAHLARSWHPRTRPDHIDVDDGTVWTGLIIEDAAEDGDAAVVAFRARWRQAGRDGELVERSRFVRRGGRWVYVDGDVA
ncbi:YchJ family metal-binding protein [Microbacterium sp. NPDC089180]|uniref:YchJ family metal-binding protein n=1 Tax=Microbacterium galbum TaxID=3075994 RepID=A0ABU3T2N2_9MICO|nr:YchJ family metal-binding protein [Microbacterium sp. KSW4-17]MDU0365634.1 YchJ family metal-binding protein [Microbacterium sp. KSW4-17]